MLVSIPSIDLLNTYECIVCINVTLFDTLVTSMTLCVTLVKAWLPWFALFS